MSEPDKAPMWKRTLVGAIALWALSVFIGLHFAVALIPPGSLPPIGPGRFFILITTLTPIMTALWLAAPYVGAKVVGYVANGRW